MSFECAAWAIQQTPSSPADKLILIALADCFNKHNSRCDPSNTYLAEHALCTERYVTMSLKRLEESGFISILRRPGRRNNYTINTPELSTGVDNQTPELSSDTPELSSKTPELSSDEPVRTNIKPRYSEFCEFFFSSIQELYPKAKKPNMKTWAKDVRLMEERDGRTIDDMKEVFLFANGHDFWSANILSPAKLRKQYDTLVAQKQQSKDVTKKTNLWDMTDRDILKRCQDQGIGTQGKTKKDLINRLEAA